MVRIKKSALEKFMGPLVEDHLDVKVSLFIVSKSNQRLKQLDLGDLTPDERAAKLRKWGQEFRFVAVIEMGDMIFAHAHPKHVERLKGGEELSLDGKKVTLKALTEEEAEQLSAVGEAFEEHVKHSGEKETKLEQSQAGRPVPRQYLAKNRLVSDQLHTHFLIDQMVKNNLSQIISNCMQKFSEARREIQKQQEAEEKYADIQRSEIKKGILKSEIKKEEVQKQDQNQRIVSENAERVNHIRGIQP